MRILICDDDQSLLQVLITHIDWKALGIEHVLTAENGVQAKELIRQFSPEIILSDIGMPLCDGVEVLKYVREIGLESEFAFLTCYEDFEYAKEAVRYGARRYLTKPLIMEELNQALKEMSDTAKEKEIRSRTQILRRSEDQLVLSTILRGLRDGLYEEDADLINNGFQNHHIDLQADTLVRLIAYRVHIENKVRPSGEHTIWQEVVMLSLTIILERDNMELSVVDMDNETLRVLLFLPETEGSLEASEVLARCRRFVRLCKEQFSVEPTLIISREIRLARTRSESRQLVQELHKLRFQEGKVFLAESENSVENKPEQQAIDEEKILGYLKNQDQAGYLRYMAGYVNQITKKQQGSDIQMTLLHHSLLRVFYTCAEDNQIDRLLMFNGDEIRTADGRCEQSSYEMIRYAGMLFEKMLGLIQAKSSSSDAIALAKNYIAEHYQENIDRDSIAEASRITPNYLSKLFHQETGQSIREYVNHLRIREAKRLLLSTDKPVSEIASDVGFENISYFSTVFRKIAGTSPLEYRSEYHPDREDQENK